MIKKYFVVLLFIFIITSCKNENNGNNNHAQKQKAMNDNSKNAEVTETLEKLNWWVSQTYNPETGAIESTGEAQAVIKQYLDKLDSLGVEYEYKNGSYTLL